MTAPEIQIKFDGGDASKHVIDMKYYALALQGAEELLSDGILLLANQRLPRPRERAPVHVKAREPLIGSVITPTDLSEVWGTLALGLPIITDIGADFLWNWIKAVIAHFSGKVSDLEVALARMAELNRDHLLARDKSEERSHEERMLTLEILREAIGMQAGAAERYASPVGRTVESSEFITGSSRGVHLDIPAAEAIREQGKVVWEKIASVRLETDGFKFHTSGLSVKNPEADGFMMATVKDPAFKDEVNAYTEAAQRRAIVSVLARKGRKNGILSKLEILEFEGVIQ